MRCKISKILISAEKQIMDLIGEKVKIELGLIKGEIDPIKDEKVKTNEMIFSVIGKDPYSSIEMALAEFSLTQLPGCCGVCVSYHASVYLSVQDKGLGTLLCSIRKDIARALGYGCMLCTDVSNNEPQQRILVKNGWKNIHRFRNPRTNNDINIHVVNL
jgi:hypothetical protein